MTSEVSGAASRAALVLVLLSGLACSAKGCEWGEEEELRRFIRVREDAPIDHVLFSITASQPHLLQLTPQDQEPDGVFRVVVEGGQGKVVVAAPLQSLTFGPSPVIKMSLTCGNNTVSVPVTVYVDDVNDHAPVFLAQNITVTVDELTPVGLTVLPSIATSDADRPNTANSEVELEIVSGNEDGFFSLADRKRGAVTLARNLDFDAGPRSFRLTVVAKDMGTPALSSTSTVSVVVLDADDLPPRFTHARYFARIHEHPGADPGVKVLQEVEVQPSPLRAVDGDAGQNTSVRYSLVDTPAARLFSLDPMSGRLFLTSHLDRENLADPSLTLHVRAEQVDDARKVGSSVVVVEVEDVNDNLPRFTQDVYSISIMENLPASFSVIQVSAQDPDQAANGAFNYHLVGGGGSLSINPRTGWLTVANQSLLDREASPVIYLRVCADQLAPMATRDARAYTPPPTEEPTTPMKELDILKEEVTAETTTPEIKTRKPEIRTRRPEIPTTTSEMPTERIRILIKEAENPEFDIPTEEQVTATEAPEATTLTEFLRVPEETTTATAFTDVIRLVETTETTETTTTSLPETTVAEELNDKEPTLVTAPLLREVVKPRDRGRTSTSPVAPSRRMARRQRIPLQSFRRRVTRSTARRSRGGYVSLTKRETTGGFREDGRPRKRRREDNVRVLLRVQRIDPTAANPLRELTEGVAAEPKENEASLQGIEDSPPRSEALRGLSRHTPPTGAFQWGETRRRGHRSTNDTQEEDAESLVPQSWSCAKVELNLLDANDNNPVFLPANQYAFTITENAKKGDVIGSVTAEDADEGKNGLVRYRIQSQVTTTNNPSSDTNAVGSVAVGEADGALTLLQSVPPGQLTVLVEASDSPLNPSETRTSLAVVTISVKATHSWQPRFEGAPFELWVGGDAPVGTSVGQVRVVDLPGPDLLFDMFHGYQEGVPFAIEEESGIVSVVTPLRNYSRSLYEFEAVVTDGRDSLATNLTIHVAPTRRPANRRDTILYFSIQENLSGGVVGDVVAALRNLSVRVPPDPQFELVSPEARQYFALAQDATLYTVAPLDYEAHSNHTLLVMSARTSDIYYVQVQVEDVNDNAPQLNAVSYLGTVQENARPGTPVALSPAVQVFDRDQYPGSSFVLELLGDASSLFSIDSSSGNITFIGRDLDREVTSSYNLLLVARDDGNLTSTANLTIHVEDVNDNPPKFMQREPLFSAKELDDSKSRKLPDTSGLKHLADLERSLIRVPESLPVGSRVTQLSATDEDDKSFADIRYTIESEKSLPFPNSDEPQIIRETNKFSVEAKTGVVIVAAKLEPNHFYVVNVTATDGGGLSSHAVAVIAVFDVNDHTPRFERPVYNFEVVEGDYLVGEVGKVVAFDQDLGENGEVHYQIILHQNASQDFVFPFRLGETSGIILTTGSVDREEQDAYEFTVVASDRGQPRLSSTVTVRIDIMDVNDHYPVFYGYQNMSYPPDESPGNHSDVTFTPIYEARVAEKAKKFTMVTRVFANDSDSSSSGNGLVLYKLEGGEDKFAIDSKNGSVYTVGPLDYERWAEYSLTVVAQDLGSPPLTASALLKVTVVDVEEELTARLFDREEYQPRFTLVAAEEPGVAAVDVASGRVFLVASLDRETKDRYHLKIRAEPSPLGAPPIKLPEYTITSSGTSIIRASRPLPLKHGEGGEGGGPSLLLLNSSDNEEDLKALVRVSADVVPLGSYLSPVVSSSVRPPVRVLQIPDHTHSRPAEELGLDEVWVTVVVDDQNDNSPMFTPHGRPIVAAVPATATYGQFVTRIVTHDPDLGLNGKVRYEILPGEGAREALTKFTVDPATGQVVVVGTLAEDAGRMFGLDVRATDRDGDAAGRSAIANVFVHVLGPGGHLVVELAAAPRAVEPHIDDLQGMMTNLTGLEVRVQRIAAHVEGDAAHTGATDVYVYAVDPVSQTVVEGAALRRALRRRRGMLDAMLPADLHLKGLRLPLPPRPGHVLQTAEVAILAGAVVVFLLTVAAIACLCYKQRKRRRKPMPLPPLVTTGGMPVMPMAYPGPFAAPYTHMSDHSSADSTEAQEGTHDHAHYPADHAHYPQEAARYPPDHAHRPRPIIRQSRCAHSCVSDIEHTCGSERFSVHTDDDESASMCARHMTSRKRRRGGEGASRVGGRIPEEPSSSDLDERDHAPPTLSVPGQPRCCARDRYQRSGRNTRGLPTVDCSAASSTRTHSPDSLEQHPHQQSRGGAIHTIPRTHLRREWAGEASGRGGGDLGGPKPSDVTEL
ncbi:cadherin-89D-like [Eriocheir sinensis]|uniref:cadherin-89D-like n=1 Tax=Eriocheir sinensis TaxID=95602 RepID=UPI0021C698D2|nr:cadherin-89D-like [Eriocheir sinensis]